MKKKFGSIYSESAFAVFPDPGAQHISLAAPSDKKQPNMQRGFCNGLSQK